MATDWIQVFRAIMDGVIVGLNVYLVFLVCRVRRRGFSLLRELIAAIKENTATKGHPK